MYEVNLIGLYARIGKIGGSAVGYRGVKRTHAEFYHCGNTVFDIHGKGVFYRRIFKCGEDKRYVCRALYPLAAREFE